MAIRVEDPSDLDNDPPRVTDLSHVIDSEAARYMATNS